LPLVLELRKNRADAPGAAEQLAAPESHGPFEKAWG